MTLQDTPREIVTFLDTVAQSPELWDSAITQVVAVKIRGEWVCLSAFCTLHLRGTARPTRKRGVWRTSRVLAVQEVTTVSLFGQLLRDIAAGSAAVAGQQIRFASGFRFVRSAELGARSNELSLEILANWNVQPRIQVSAAAVPPPMVNVHLLSVQGGTSARSLLDQADGGYAAVNEELRSRRNNLNGIEHLVRRNCASLYNWTPDYGVGISVVAPLGVAFNAGRTEFRGEKLRLSLLAASKTAVRLGRVGISGDASDNRPIVTEVQFGKQTWNAEAGLLTAEVQYEFRSVETLSLLLRIKDSSVHNIELKHVDIRPNPLQVAHTAHHPSSDMEWRQYLLEAKGSHADKFAAAVARLVNGLGIPTVHFPRQLNSDSSDSIARLGRDHLLLIESTTSSFDGKKLGNLVRRASELRRELRRRGISVSDEFIQPVAPRLAAHSVWGSQGQTVCIVPVMAVSIPYADVLKATLKDAQISHVVVFTQEDLMHLLSLCDTDADYEEALGELISSRIRGPLV